MDRLTYDTLTAASAVLSALARAGEREFREEAVQAMRARLHACEAERDAKAA